MRGAWFVVIVLSLLTRLNANELEMISGRAFGTTYEVKIANRDPDVSIDAVRNLVADELERIEAIFSLYRIDSELTRWNAVKANEWIDVSHDLFSVVEFAIELSKQSKGAFDPTVRPLIELWHLDDLSGSWTPPTEQSIQSILSDIGIANIELRRDSKRIRKRNDFAKMDLNALVEGWAIDRVLQLLQQAGVKDVLFGLGGEFGGRGNRSESGGWQVGIEAPCNPPNIDAIISVENAALSTSGNYRQSRRYAGKRYSHIFDPRTGQPIHHDLTAVSVLHPSAMTADGWATALLILGPDLGKSVAEQHGLVARFVHCIPNKTFATQTSAAQGKFCEIAESIHVFDLHAVHIVIGMVVVGGLGIFLFAWFPNRRIGRKGPKG